MPRFLYILYLTFFGFILIPTEGYACGISQEKQEHTCTDKSSNPNIQDCCKKADSSHGKKGCDGVCSNAGCHCPTVFSNVIIPVFAQSTQLKFIENKTTFYYQETYCSARFLSIWQPPKIG